MPIQRLDKPVSSQVVATASLASVISVVKELIENSIDACVTKKGAQIYLEIDDNSGGLEHLLIRDNGIGVIPEDRNIMCLNHTTSKITKWEDLESNLSTCGFRGEALHYICQTAQKVQISTKTDTDIVCETWDVTSSGLVDGSFLRSSGSNGTTVKVEGLFRRTPVRYNFFKKEKKKTLQQLHRLLLTYSLIYPSIRFQVKYVRVLPNGKIASVESATFNPGLTPMQLLRSELNIRNASTLFTLEKTFELSLKESGDYKVLVYGVFPRSTASDAIVTKQAVKILCINNRPLDVKLSIGKAISKRVTEAFTENLLIAPSVWFMKLTIPNKFIDVNIEPEKSDVLVNDEESFLKSLFKCISEYIREIHGAERSEITSSGHNLAEKHSPKVFSQNGQKDSGDNGPIINTLKDFVKKTPTELLEVDSDERLGVSYKNTDDGDLSNDNELLVSKKVQNSGPEVDQDLFELEDRPGQQSEKLIEVSVDDVITDHLVADQEIENGIVLNEQSSEILNDAEQTGAHHETIVDDTTFLEQNGLNEEQTVTVNRSDNLSSVMNPRELSKIVNNMKSSRIQTITSDTINSKRKPELTAADLAISTESKVPKLAARPTLGPHITHTIDASPRKKRPQVQSQIPSKIAPYRVTEMTQNTLGIVVCGSFHLEKNDAQKVVDFEEKWVKRKGIPSEIVLEGLKDMYISQSYQLMNESGTFVVNEIGIAKLV